MNLAVLKEVLDYNSNTGQFTWLIQPSSKVPLFSEAGSINNGYRYITYNGSRYAAHRLAWAFTYGCLPVGMLDHVDRDKDNNAILNLRESNPTENGLNRGLQSNNKSGHKNISYFKRTNKWKVEIKRHGKTKHIGYFKTLKEAIQARGRYVG